MQCNNMMHDHDTTRNLLIHDRLNPSQTCAKPSWKAMHDGLKIRHVYHVTILPPHTAWRILDFHEWHLTDMLITALTCVPHQKLTWMWRGDPWSNRPNKNFGPLNFRSIQGPLVSISGINPSHFSSSTQTLRHPLKNANLNQYKFSRSYMLISLYKSNT